MEKNRQAFGDCSSLSLNSRNAYIDLLKLIFTICVVQVHMRHFQCVDFQVMRGGHISVEFFFICSGFFSVCSCERLKKNNLSTGRATEKFILSKLRRLYPVWLVSLILLIFYSFISKEMKITELGTVIMESFPSVIMLSSIGLQEKMSIPFAWYIPTMLVVLLIAFPLLYLNRSLAKSVIAPLFFLFGCSYLLHRYGKIFVLTSEEDWIGFTYASLIRGGGRHMWRNNQPQIL